MKKILAIAAILLAFPMLRAQVANPPSIAAGTNVTITQGSPCSSGTCTINATGGGGGYTGCTSDGFNGIICTGDLTGASILSGTPSTAAKAALPSGSHGISCDQSSTAGVPASGVDYIRCDSTNGLVSSTNGGAESPLVGGDNWVVSAPTPTFSPSAGAIIINTPVTATCSSGTCYASVDGSSLASTCTNSLSVPTVVYARCELAGTKPTNTNASYTILSTYYADRFDTTTVGTLPTGWANQGSATFQVGTNAPVSVPNDLEDPTFHLQGIAVYTGASAVADSAVLFSQVVHLDGSGNGASTGMFIRSDSTAANGYLFAMDFHLSLLYVFKKVSGTYTILNGSGTSFSPTFTDGQVASVVGQVQGTTLKAKIWRDGSAEPGSWLVTLTDSSISAAGYIATYEGFNGGNHASTISSIDNLAWAAPGTL